MLFVLHIRECDLQVQAFGKSFVSATSITRQCFTTSGMICRVSFDYDYCSLLESKDVKIQIESLNSFGLVKTVYKPVSVCDVIDAVRRRSASPLPPSSIGQSAGKWNSAADRPWESWPVSSH